MTRLHIIEDWTNVSYIQAIQVELKFQGKFKSLCIRVLTGREKHHTLSETNLILFFHSRINFIYSGQKQNATLVYAHTKDF